MYDFRNPKEHIHEGDAGFHWWDIDSEWMSWTPKQFIDVGSPSSGSWVQERYGWSNKCGSAGSSDAVRPKCPLGDGICGWFWNSDYHFDVGQRARIDVPDGNKICHRSRWCG